MFFFIGVKPDDDGNKFEGLGKLLENIWLAALSSGYDFVRPWDKNIFVILCVFLFSIFSTIVFVNLLSMYLQISFVALKYLLITNIHFILTVAFVNDIYIKTFENLDIVWNLYRARYIANIELTCLLPSERNNKYVETSNLLYLC